MKKDPKLAKFDWVYPNSFTEKYHYYCDNAYLRDLGKTTILNINTVICLVLLYLADKIGRKSVLILGSTNIVIGMAINAFYPQMFIKLLGLGFAAGSEGIFSAVFTMMINEVTRKFIPLILFKLKPLVLEVPLFLVVSLLILLVVFSSML